MKIGTDIVQIQRIATAVEKFGEKFLRRFLSKEEIETLGHKPESLAGYWAAKEAIAKALGTGIGSEIGFHDIRLGKDEKGAPFFHLLSDVQTRFRVKESSLSISHDGGFAIAVAVIIFSNITND